MNVGLLILLILDVALSKIYIRKEILDCWSVFSLFFTVVLVLTAYRLDRSFTIKEIVQLANSSEKCSTYSII